MESSSEGNSDNSDCFDAAQEMLAEGLFDFSIPFLPETLPFILQVGCGTDFLSLDIESLYPAGHDILDSRETHLKITQKQLTSFFPNAKYRLLQGEAETLDTNDRYDLIYSASLGNFADLNALVNRITTWLKPSGRIFFGLFHTAETEKELSALMTHTGLTVLDTAKSQYSEATTTVACTRELFLIGAEKRG
jgi:ubiquinone/menaquinone biosynthesis C-methylase UbiE